MLLYKSTVFVLDLVFCYLIVTLKSERYKLHILCKLHNELYLWLRSYIVYLVTSHVGDIVKVPLFVKVPLSQRWRVQCAHSEYRIKNVVRTLLKRSRHNTGNVFERFPYTLS